MSRSGKALILSVGYGAGHHAAARAVAEELESRNWRTFTLDPCLAAHPYLFELSRRFYQFCVRQMPWLWGVTYAQAGTADWSVKAHSLILSDVTACIVAQVKELRPDVVICTYPLFAHMLDTLAYEKVVNVPYVVVVTDSLEISRPWMVTRAPYICLPDEYSHKLMSERYAISADRMLLTGFPVRKAFACACSEEYSAPAPDNLRIVYGAYAPLVRVRADLYALIRHYPNACITVIAGERYKDLQDFNTSRVEVLHHTDNMADLFARSHFYVGKAGAATLYEAYAAELPVIVNYSLPGQEQGNLALLLLDGAGVTAGSASELIAKLSRLLKDGAAGWKRLKKAMRSAGRVGGAKVIADMLEKVIQYEQKC